jgi:CheY-like chemotaxis protein
MPTVLITDDSKTTQMLVMRALHTLSDVQFLCAENGVEALEVLASSEVDLLVTDINMPEMDGIELIRQVRQTRRAEDLPILIITAKAELSAKDQGLMLGANAYILKPLSGQELIQKAQGLLDGSRKRAHAT